jgi:DNA primase
VTHPALAGEFDQSALAAVGHFAPDGAAMLTQLVEAGCSLGPNASFAALAERLRTENGDFDALIAEVAGEGESAIETARLELAGAVRQTRMKLLKAEMEQLVGAGLGTDAARERYRELTLQQEQLRRQAVAEIAQR